MRVCLICVTYPPYNTSGATRYFYDVSRKLAEKGIYVDVITSPIENEEIKRDGKITIHRINAMDFEKKSESEREQQTRELLAYLEKLTKKKKIDIISCQDIHSWPAYNPGYSIAANILSINKKIPVINTIHSFYGLESSEKPAFISLKNLFWDRIIGVSGAISDKIHSLGIDIDKISICTPGVDIDRFRPDLGKKWLRTRVDLREKDKVVLYAGRISEQKGINELLKAFSLMAQKNTNYKLLIAAGIASIKHLDEFEETVKKTYERAELLGLKDKVIIQRFALDEMPHVYNGADIFVLPSKSEAFGLVYAEAMSCGLPVVGTSTGGIPEVITNGEDGYLVPVDDTTELAKKMESLLKSKKRRDSMSKKGLEKAHQKFDLNKTTEKLVGIYRSAICRRDKICENEDKKEQ